MSIGTLYGIGVGPGDPELITVKGARLISECDCLFVPKARIKSESVAYEIVKRYVGDQTEVRELVFPMVTEKTELRKKWIDSATQVAEVLREGKSVCFITLGDSLLYSTYIYLVRELMLILPEAKVVTIPGVMALAAVAALTNFPVGEGKELVTIVPSSDDLQDIEDAIKTGGSVVIMKVGKRLQPILELLDNMNVIDDAVFVAGAGMEERQIIETDLRALMGAEETKGYLSTILLHTKGYQQ